MVVWHVWWCGMCGGVACVVVWHVWWCGMCGGVARVPPLPGRTTTSLAALAAMCGICKLTSFATSLFFLPPRSLRLRVSGRRGMCLCLVIKIGSPLYTMPSRIRPTLYATSCTCTSYSVYLNYTCTCTS